MNEMRYQLELLKAMNQKLTEKEKIYEKVFQAAEDIYLYCSLKDNRAFALGRWEDFFDFELRDSRDFSGLLDAVEERYALDLRELLFLEKLGGTERCMECRLKDERTWLRFRVRINLDCDGNPCDKLIYISDVTRTRAELGKLAGMAYFDSLTGLYNRSRFVNLLGEFVRRAAEDDGNVSVLVIDVDNFRKVNDSLGIEAGDGLIRQIGLFLKEFCADENIMAGHLHSDVFCMAIYGAAGNRSVEAVYDAIRRRLKEPFAAGPENNIVITVCVGAAEYPQAAETAPELLNCAELMVNRCKEQGKNMLQYFKPPASAGLLDSGGLEDKLKNAVCNRDFHVCYQPQFYAGNRMLRGVEALLRWKDEEEHMISPSLFIPVAEKGGTIIPVGKWVVEESVRQYALWRKRFGFPFIMAINISALQYKRDDFAEFIADVLNRYRVKPSEIELEITENVMLEDFDQACGKLRTLKNHGFRVALDNFGTGFASLTYLKKLPVDTIKIDKTFIDAILTDSATRVITESVIHMAKSLGFQSIAEGVEEEQQYRYLHAAGCDVIQGYLFGRPLPSEEFEEILTEQA